MKKSINELRAESTLNKVFRYPEGIMSRKEFLNICRVRGATVEEKQVPKIEYNRLKFNRLTGAAQDEYWQKCQEKKTGYSINFTDGTSQDITKTEYDYFKALELAEDINTQKNELSQKIEAGIATDDEIETEMENEFEFFRKYATD
jgi:hypothetical protein